MNRIVKARPNVFNYIRMTHFEISHTSKCLETKLLRRMTRHLQIRNLEYSCINCLFCILYTTYTYTYFICFDFKNSLSSIH